MRTHAHIHSMRFHFNNNFFRNCSPIEWNQNDILHKHIFLHFYAKKTHPVYPSSAESNGKLYLSNKKESALNSSGSMQSARIRKRRSHANAFAIYLGLAASIATKRKKAANTPDSGRLYSSAFDMHSNGWDCLGWFVFSNTGRKSGVEERKMGEKIAAVR